MIFIVLSTLQALKNNKRRVVNSRVYSIFLKCLKTLVKHKPRVYEITSQLFIVEAEPLIAWRCFKNEVIY